LALTRDDLDAVRAFLGIRVSNDPSEQSVAPALVEDERERLA
jgi:hypothetical protein